ncbi:hypothetical protein O3M35_008259 [Rhynocoris fuscipes]|uniref:Uncharacterized protein n=1 Tax=Rhynocoris fuscipes TaxID=488301 RepID=A0AAW1D7Z5_9HEMI
MLPDSQLFLLYLSTTISSLISMISVLTAWIYWQRTLNTCHVYELDMQRNCGCILYGKWGVQYFRGGDSAFCQFVGLAPTIVILWSGVIAMYHGYRVHCSVKPAKVTLISKDGVQVINPQVWSKPLIVFTFIMSIAISILTFSIGVVLTDGYIKTCREYKKTVIKQLSANGNLAELIFDRMTCGTIYDFIDYLQPDPDFLEFQYRRGNWKLHTDLALTIALWCTWFTLGLYICIAIITFKCSRINKKRPVLNTDL